MNELEIPDEALDVASSCSPATWAASDHVFEDDLRRIAAPIVAAELRRLADEISSGCHEYVVNGASDVIRVKAMEDLTIASKLRARADALEEK